MHVLVLGTVPSFCRGTKISILGNIFDKIRNWHLTIPQLGVISNIKKVLTIDISLYLSQIWWGSAEQSQRNIYTGTGWGRLSLGAPKDNLPHPVLVSMDQRCYSQLAA